MTERSERLLRSVQSVLADYEGTAVTVRQLYYRLVAATVLPNSVRSYKNLVASLTDWRRRRLVPLDAFEDRTRGMRRYDFGLRSPDPTAWLRGSIQQALDTADRYRLARWAGQNYRVVVAVEKQSLEGVFSQVCRELQVDLVVCRGYPSLSLLREVAHSLSDENAELDGRTNTILYFGDFDPSGMSIPGRVERDLGHDYRGESLFNERFEFTRVALTRAQVKEFSLLPAPVKTTDSRAGAFIDEFGLYVYELDAIEPRALADLIRESVSTYFDDAVSVEAERKSAEGRAWVRRNIERLGLREAIQAMNEGEGDGPSSGRLGG